MPLSRRPARRGPLLLGGLILTLLLLALPRPTLAIGEWERGDLSLEATGALRLTGALLHAPDDSLLLSGGDDGVVSAIARLILGGTLHARVSYELNGYLDLSRSPGSPGTGALSTVGALGSPYRTRYLRGVIWQDGAVRGELGLDRLALTFRLSPLSITVGRFPVNYAVGQIFTPADLFAPFSTAAINKIYKPGVDALRLNLELSPLASLELLGVLGSDEEHRPSWGQIALLARASAVKWETQWAIFGGKLARRWLVAGTFQGQLAGLGLRGGAQLGFPDADGDGTLDENDPDAAVPRKVHLRANLGADKVFVWRNAQLGLELLFRSDGATLPARYPERAAHLYPDDLPFAGKLYLGLSGGLDILPILRAGALVLLNAGDYSGLALASLSYSVADEADLLAGLLVPWGARAELATSAAEGLFPGSEYGDAPLTVFIESRVYF